MIADQRWHIAAIHATIAIEIVGKDGVVECWRVAEIVGGWIAFAKRLAIGKGIVGLMTARATERVVARKALIEEEIFA